jgi:thiamine biosynthesis protein ThiS
MAQIKVLLNGNSAEAPEGASLALFLDLLGLGRKGIGVERNREIVPKSKYDSTFLQPGDQLEVVQFVGGG